MMINKNITPRADSVDSVEDEIKKLEDNFNEPSKDPVKYHCSKINKQMVGYALRNQNLDTLFNKKLKYKVDMQGNFIHNGMALFTFLPFENLDTQKTDTKVEFKNHGKASLRFEDYYSLFMIFNEIVESKNPDVNDKIIFFRSLITTRTCKILTTSEQKIKMIQYLRNNFLEIQNKLMKASILRIYAELHIAKTDEDKNLQISQNDIKRTLNIDVGYKTKDIESRIKWIDNSLPDRVRLEKIKEIEEEGKIQISELNTKADEDLQEIQTKYETKRSSTEKLFNENLLNSIAKMRTDFDHELAIFFKDISDLAEKREKEIEELEKNQNKFIPSIEAKIKMQAEIKMQNNMNSLNNLRILYAQPIEQKGDSLSEDQMELNTDKMEKEMQENNYETVSAFPSIDHKCNIPEIWIGQNILYPVETKNYSSGCIFAGDF